MNTERLKDMLDVLRAPLPGEFRIGTWEYVTDCGFAGCAVGNYCKARPDSGLTLIRRQPRFGQFSNWEAVEKFFGVSLEQATWLFEGWQYPDELETTVAEVADRVEAFIASGGVIEPVEAGAL